MRMPIASRHPASTESGSSSEGVLRCERDCGNHTMSGAQCPACRTRRTLQPRLRIGYCTDGLVLTVAEPLGGDGPTAIARAGGIAPLASPHAFGPAYCLPFADQIRWSSPESDG
jgi:hypothetical protein